MSKLSYIWYLAKGQGTLIIFPQTYVYINIYLKYTYERSSDLCTITYIICVRTVAPRTEYPFMENWSHIFVVFGNNLQIVECIFPKCENCCLCCCIIILLFVTFVLAWNGTKKFISVSTVLFLAYDVFIFIFSIFFCMVELLNIWDFANFIMLYTWWCLILYLNLLHKQNAKVCRY